jgi:hypothetical protein
MAMPATVHVVGRVEGGRLGCWLGCWPAMLSPECFVFTYQEPGQEAFGGKFTLYVDPTRALVKPGSRKSRRGFQLCAMVMLAAGVPLHAVHLCWGMCRYSPAFPPQAFTAHTHHPIAEREEDERKVGEWTARRGFTMAYTGRVGRSGHGRPSAPKPSPAEASQAPCLTLVGAIRDPVRDLSSSAPFRSLPPLMSHSQIGLLFTPSPAPAFRCAVSIMSSAPCPLPAPSHRHYGCTYLDT